MVMPMCWSLMPLLDVFKETLVARAEAVDEIYLSQEVFQIKNPSMFAGLPQPVRNRGKRDGGSL